MGGLATSFRRKDLNQVSPTPLGGRKAPDEDFLGNFFKLIEEHGEIMFIQENLGQFAPKKSYFLGNLGYLKESCSSVNLGPCAPGNHVFSGYLSPFALGNYVSTRKLGPFALGNYFFQRNLGPFALGNYVFSEELGPISLKQLHFPRELEPICLGEQCFLKELGPICLRQLYIHKEFGPN
jgi:hypothetical protein